MTPEQKDKALIEAYNSLQEKKRKDKLEVLNRIRGKIRFDKTGCKSAMDIQREMRNEWQ